MQSTSSLNDVEVHLVISFNKWNTDIEQAPLQKSGC